MPWKWRYLNLASYDAIEVADPDVHRVLFENENVMFLEVANPPGLDVRMHGHPYPSVFARDTGGAQTTSGVVLDDKHIDPDSRAVCGLRGGRWPTGTRWFSLSSLHDSASRSAASATQSRPGSGAFLSH